MWIRFHLHTRILCLCLHKLEDCLCDLWHTLDSALLLDPLPQGTFVHRPKPKLTFLVSLSVTAFCFRAPNGLKFLTRFSLFPLQAAHARVFYPLLRLFLTVMLAARFAVLVSSNRRRNNKQPRAQTFQIQLKRPTVEASDKSHDNTQATAIKERVGEGAGVESEEGGQ